jgi:hypothetical protein
MREPPAFALAAPAPPAPGPAPEARIDEERARASILEDYAIRRLAQPDEAEERYQQELERLRRRYVELREQARASAPKEEDVQRSLRLAEQIRSLEQEVKDLQENPSDRLLYRPEQLRQRRERRRQKQEELVEARGKQNALLEESLAVPKHVQPQVPPARIQQAEKRRDEERKRSLEALKQQERSDLAELSRTALPAPPAPETPPPPSEESALAARDRMKERARAAPVSRFLPDRVGSADPAALKLLRRRREQLLTLIYEDLRAAAVTAGRSAGIEVTFEAGRAPDRTAQLLPRVHAVLEGKLPPGGQR